MTTELSALGRSGRLGATEELAATSLEPALMLGAVAPVSNQSVSELEVILEFRHTSSASPLPRLWRRNGRHGGCVTTFDDPADIGLRVTVC